MISYQIEATVSSTAIVHDIACRELDVSSVSCSSWKSDESARGWLSLRASSLFRRITSSRTSIIGTGDLKGDFWGPLGLNLLHEPAESRIDFVFPKKWLPKEPFFEHVRIHSFGYNSNWRERATSIVTIHDFGQALLGDIHTSPSFGDSADQTPIVLIGHSMGGLSNLLSLVRGKGSKPYVESLFPYSEVIQTINDQFRHTYEGIQLWSFFETQPTILGLIVDKWSAVSELPGEQISHLNADHSNVCKFNDPTDSDYGRLRDAFTTAIKSIHALQLAIKASPETHDQEDLMRVISRFLGIVESPEIDYENNIEHRTDGSCSWLMKKESFLQWLDGKQPPKCYWLRGEPGSGKSIIAAYVIQHLKESNKDCAYFFFKDNSAEKSRIARLLCSLAYQMAATNQEIRKGLVEVCESNVTFNRRDERSIWRTLFTTKFLRTQLSRPQYWVIDALDECEKCSPLFSFLASVEASFPLLVFFTSRPSLTIERLISGQKMLTVTDDITRGASLCDITLFVESHSVHFLTDSEHERDELVENIIARSNGNFLWTNLIVNKILDAISAEQVHDCLVSSPDEMSELYASILRKVMAIPETREIACGILRWTLCALRPLHVDELQEALKLDIGKSLNQLGKMVGSICGNLIIVDAKSCVMVAHQTVREYLYRQHNNLRFSIVETTDHARLFEVCLAYLSTQELSPPRSRQTRPSTTKEFPFSEYAILHFSDHLIRASSSDPAYLITLSTFLTSNALAWIETVARTQDIDPLIQAAKNFRMFLGRMEKYQCALGNEMRTITTWTNDIAHLVALFW
ncbi:hypothetical protein BO94DRAFT_581717 [Aspergillus sclerotioniger CBS 115572]|uniref:Uncharacterized protein n=1 Tax=Aspergillus sclerotioniger CBS 115572 TaxID=1450535 RepID=A0A317X9X2_9EURO|nr:hypothetical protein BO94DRAFT_581717 [Aspergillus sclerotioniger CBS 115572]PWY95386.1 hypothetical protein BO94DRAFT_581717 [Aspergillus sclerotioniger CBS 115572]